MARDDASRPGEQRLEPVEACQIVGAACRGVERRDLARGQVVAGDEDPGSGQQDRDPVRGVAGRRRDRDRTDRRVDDPGRGECLGAGPVRQRRAGRTPRAASQAASSASIASRSAPQPLRSSRGRPGGRPAETRAARAGGPSRRVSRSARGDGHRPASAATSSGSTGPSMTSAPPAPQIVCVVCQAALMPTQTSGAIRTQAHAAQAPARPAAASVTGGRRLDEHVDGVGVGALGGAARVRGDRVGVGQRDPGRQRELDEGDLAGLDVHELHVGRPHAGRRADARQDRGHGRVGGGIVDVMAGPRGPSAARGGSGRR